MPLHGKIVVVKRSGVDGTEFPLTATCLFGRRQDCDIRIQLPQVSKEHCRIDLNENKEVILTNLSSVNPTRVNGEALQQSERLKHGDVITIIDRSFRFEYPPPPTPKKRSSIRGKTETFKVLQDQQVGDLVTTETGEKRVSEVSADPHLKDGTNHDNIQRSLDKTMEVESKEDNKTTSPFNDLYQMIKKSLDVKTPKRSSSSLLQTPSSRFCTPKPVSVRKTGGNVIISSGDKSNPKKDDAKVTSGADETKGEADNTINVTPKSAKKLRRSFKVPSTEMTGPEPQDATKSEASSPQKRNRATPQRFTVSEVIEQVTVQTSKSPVRRRSKEAAPAKQEQEKQTVSSPKTEQAEGVGEVKASKKRKSGELSAKLPTPQMKKKRVSFGGQLSPELFDKRLPPNSPLRRGATPRRSLSLFKPKQSLLRRASVIGLIQEFEQDHPHTPSVHSPAKMRTPSPKKLSSAKNTSPKTPTPGKKSPKSKNPSPKVASSAKKSPKPRSPSPKATSPAKKSPKSMTPPQAATGKKSPKSRSPSPKAASPAKVPKSKSPSPAKGRSPSRNKVETPMVNEQLTPVQTPTVRGRFSVSRISTPSPVAEDAVADPVPLVTVTPKLPLKRKSTSRKTPSNAKNAVEVMRRRSGISRASMRGKSWADIVKFGQTKVQVAAPVKKVATNKTVKKKFVPKPQTPARKIKGHVSTGHANSPVTIVLSRACKQMVVCPTGAAPRLVTNTALMDMKMDEDLTGISEMYKTPVNERKRKSVINENSIVKTPVGGLGTSVVEPSVLNTPEEPGEMMVSPLSVSSTVKDRRYNCEAVQRLLNQDQMSSFITDVSVVETHSDDSSEQQSTDLKTNSVTTPKQKLELPECLTGVKRIMKTPRQKVEPVEDIRGRLLKTPKQKPEQQECLTGVKRIMKTPRLKAEPVEDLRGKILKTPKQKPEPQECFSEVKRIFKTPQQAQPLELKLVETPKAPGAGDISLDGVKESVEAPAHIKATGDLEPEMTGMKTPYSSPSVCLTGIKRLMKTPKEKSAPVEDMFGVKRLMKTPKEKNEAIEDNFGIKRLVKSPRLRGIPPVEDFDGLQQLMEEPLTDSKGQQEITEVEDQTSPDCGVDIAKELVFVHEEPQDDVPSEEINNVHHVDTKKEADANEVLDDHIKEMPCRHDPDVTSDATGTLPQPAMAEHLPVEEPRMEMADENLLEEKPKVDTVEETVSEEEPKVEAAPAQVLEMDMATTDPDHEKTLVQSRRAKIVESRPNEDKQEATEHSEDPVVTAPARGRRGRKTEAAAPPAVRQTTRSRNAKTTEGIDVELSVKRSASLSAEAAQKPKRGRNAKKTSDAQVEMVQEVDTETETVLEPESEQIPPTEAVHNATENAASLEKPALKPKRGRRAKQPEQSVAEQQHVPCAHSDDAPQSDISKEMDADGVCSDQLEVIPSQSDEDKSSDVMETIVQAPATESLPEDTAACKVGEMDAAVVHKKSVRGRRAKVVETKSVDDKQEVTGHSEEPVVPATVRGRRGRKTEAAAPPAVRQTRRNLKSQESTPDEQPEIVPEKVVETLVPEAVSEQTPPVNTSQENDSTPPAEEAVIKPIRGRKTMQKPVTPPQPKPEETECMSDEHLMAEAQSQKSIPAVEKPRRGRKPGTVKQREVAEDYVTVETRQQPAVRAKRGRNFKQEEEKQVNDANTTSSEISKSQDPVKKLRRTRNAEQDHVKPREVQTADMVVPEEAEVILDAEAVKINEQAAKPRRGGRKAKQDTESETPVESTEVKEISAVHLTDKPKRGRRRKQVTEEIEVTAVAPKEQLEQELKAEERSNTEPDTPNIKHSRARGVKPEVSQAIPAKRARRGVAPTLKDTTAESAIVVSESAATSEEPIKRGRRAAAKPTMDVSTVTSDQANPNEDSSTRHTQIPLRSVRIPTKAVQGQKSKLRGQVDAESKNVSKDVDNTEEKDLSDKDVKLQPVKRARRGAKVADTSTKEEETTSKVASVEAETKPKTRRGRSAK